MSFKVKNSFVAAAEVTIKYVFSLFLNTDSDEADVTTLGRLLHTGLYNCLGLNVVFTCRISVACLARLTPSRDCRSIVQRASVSLSALVDMTQHVCVHVVDRLGWSF